MLCGLTMWLALGLAGAADAQDGTSLEAERRSPVVETTGSERPRPWLWNRTMLAVSGWPTGMIADVRLQQRVALKRGPSFVLQDTYAGIGARLAASPAFVDVGPRFSLAPVDFFDIDLQAGMVGYWPSSSGLLPYDRIGESTRDRDRALRHRDPDTAAAGGWAAYASAQPTLKAKLGPVILYDSWSFTWFHVERPEGEDAELVYEPYWDRRLAWDDMVMQQEVGLLGEILDGEGGRPRLLVGAQFRHRWTLKSKDPSMVVGGMAIVRLVDKPGVPAIAAQVLAHVVDPDRVGGAPNMGLALVWANDLRSPLSTSR